MELQTKIAIAKSDYPIKYDSEILSLGSCFAVNIGDQFDYFKFRNLSNPFGILFHPMAIHEMVRRSVHLEKYTEADLFHHNELWHCFDVHSDLSHPDPNELLDTLNTRLEQTHAQIRNATHVVITYGTAWAYRFKSSGKLVANCHKVPHQQFKKELLDISILETAVSETIKLLNQVNPNAHTIFTISPVRHLKDGFVQNQISKSHLIAALHSQLNQKVFGASYFPSYEIMMDELRDYRFYADDLLHPSAMAIRYIWQRFSDAFIADDAKAIMNEVSQIQKALHHKPFHRESQSHQLFLLKLQQQIAALQKQIPFIRF